jgi:membrane protease YdiL (CAAX protease family)
MRYLLLLAYVVVLAIVLVGLESILRVSGAPVSLTDSRGIGEVSLLVIVLGSLLVFVQYAAGVNPVSFFRHYAARWRRALAGWATMAAFTMLLASLLLAVFISLGRATWSAEHWDALGLRVLGLTLANLAAALVLATTEELIFRASLLRYLRSSLSAQTTLVAILVSSAIFAVSHLVAFKDDPSGILSLMVGLFLLGTLLATTYVVTGSIACSIGVHFGLLGFKVILRETHIAAFQGDVRTGLDFYILMVSLILLVLVLRKWLWARFAIEPAALLEEDLRAKRISSF